MTEAEIAKGLPAMDQVLLADWPESQRQGWVFTAKDCGSTPAQMLRLTLKGIFIRKVGRNVFYQWTDLGRRVADILRESAA